MTLSGSRMAMKEISQQYTPTGMNICHEILIRSIENVSYICKKTEREYLINSFIFNVTIKKCFFS